MATIPITPNQRIRHGGEQYEAGEEYNLDPALGGYFVMNGWADSPEVDSPGEGSGGPVDLKVDDSHHDHDSER